MAKRYDSQDDFKKDALREEVLKTQVKAERQATSGMALIGGSLLADFFHQREPESRGWLQILSLGLTIAGITQAIRSWITSMRGHTLETERQKMGPLVVVLPPEQGGAEPECGCKDKLHAQPIGSKTLLAQAIRSDDLTPGKY